MVVKTGLSLQCEEHILRSVRIKDEENNELSDKKQHNGASYTVKSFKFCSIHPVFVIKSNRMGQSWHKTVVGSIYQTPAVKSEQ
jgi:hypothetical protein